MIAAPILAALALALAFAAPTPTRRAEVCPGAEWFHRTNITPPTWTADLEVACVIGDHVFYRTKGVQS